MALLPDGRILAAGRAGYYYEQDFGIALYNSDGSLDTNFSGDGKVTTDFDGGRIDFARGVALQADGNIVAVGATFDGFAYDFAIARYQAPTVPSGTATPTPTGTPPCVPATWSQQAGYPIPVLDQAVTVHGGLVYSFGGYSNNGYTANAYKYDPSTNAWTSIASLPFPREKASAVSDGTYIYVLGGWDTAGTPTNTVYRYNPATNGYSTMASFNTPTSAQAAAYLNGKIYRIGGCAGNCGAGTATVEVYTISSNTWAAAASLPQATSWPQAFVQGNYIYMAGGFNPNATSKTLRYDPSANTWDDAAIADMPGTRWGAASASLNGKGIMAGGDVNGYTSNDVIAWDPSTNTWSSLSPMPISRRRTEGAAINGAFYVAGGSGISGGFIGTNNLQRYLETNCATNTPLPTNTIVPGATATSTFTPIGCTLDTTFGTDGKVFTNFGTGGNSEGIYANARQADGKLVVAGYGGGDFVVARYNADYTLDTGFGLGGFAVADFSLTGDEDGELSDAAFAVAIAPDGKIVVTGVVDRTNSTSYASTYGVARFLPNGTLDTSFSGDGKIIDTSLGFNYESHSGVLVLPDGKIVVGGTRDESGFANAFALVRYNVDGTLDGTFGTGGRSYATISPTGSGIYALSLQPDGKLVAAGYSNNTNFDPTLALARFNSNGSLDTGFGSNGVVTNTFDTSISFANAIALASDGKIAVVGESNDDFAVARYNPDGTPDTSFSGDGKLTTDFGTSEDANAVALQPDGRTLVAGRKIISFSNFTRDFALARYNADGTLDTGFDTDGKVTVPFGGAPDDDGATSLSLQVDGKIVALGYAGINPNHFDLDFALSRLNTNGSLDTTFDGDGKITAKVGGSVEGALDMVVRPNGKIVAAGALEGEFALAQYNADGTLDTSFGTGGKVITEFQSGGLASSVAFALILQPDGKVIAGGNRAVTSGFYYDFALARYNLDGTLDTSFGTGGKVEISFNTTEQSYDSEIKDLILQPDGKIVAAGYALGQDFPTTLEFALTRLNPDGSLDGSFDGDGKVLTTFPNQAEAYALALQPDGKLVAAGNLRISSGRYAFALARYNTDGSLDTSFDTDGILSTSFGTSVDGANALAIQADGKIVAGGHATFSGSKDFALARYNVDGSLDAGFDGDGKATTAISTGTDKIHSLLVQPDGKIMAAGEAGANDFSDFTLARYGSNGSLDTSFGNAGKLLIDFSNGDTDIAYALTRLPDGKLLLGGVAETGVVDSDFALVRLSGCEEQFPTATPTVTGTPPTSTLTATSTATRTNTAAPTATGTPTPCSSATQTVSIVDFAFSPQSKTIYVGETVRWTNNGAANHTTTSDTGVWNSGTMSASVTFNFTFSAPGTYTYKCNIHPSMTGTITVQAGCPPTSTPTSTATSMVTNTATATATSQPAVTSTPCATNVALAGSGGSIAGFSSSYGGVYGPEKMIDGTAGGWSTAGGQTTNQWIIVALPGGNSYTIDRVRLNPYTPSGSGYAADSIRNFQVRVSTTDTQISSFATVYTGVAPQQNTFYEYSFTPVAAKYVMLFVVDNYGGGYVEGTEFEVYPVCGSPVPTAAATLMPTNTATPTNSLTSTPIASPTETATPVPGTPTPIPSCGPAWRISSSPNVEQSANFLEGVSAYSATNVWAVGSSYDGNTYNTLVEHWDGSAWTIVSSPNPPSSSAARLYAVSAVAPDLVWAVGYYFDTNESRNKTLVLRYDGSTWAQVSSASPGSFFNYLYGVTAQQGGDAWAVGYYRDENNFIYKTLILHYNGTSWVQVTSPNPGLYENYLEDVTLLPSGEAWAVGSMVGGVEGAQHGTLALHYDGSTWQHVLSPNPSTDENRLYGVAASSSNKLWAVGTTFNSTTGSFESLILAYNGSGWARMSSPNGSGHGINRLESVTAISDTEAVAVGMAYDYDTSLTFNLIARLSGGSWSPEGSPNPSPYLNTPKSVDALSASDIWSAGTYDYQEPYEVIPRTFILHYNDPCGGAATATVTPGVAATATATATSTAMQTATVTNTPTITPTSTGRVLCVWTSPGVTTYSPCANPTAFASIQSAINAANPGDEIRLVQGVHMGTGSAVGVINKALTITGGYTGGMTGWGVPQANSSTSTIVDGQGVRKGFEVQGATAVTIQNLAISSGGILNNAGTVNVPGYILNLQSGGTSNGAFNVSAGAVLNFPSGAHTLDVGTTITGAGMWRVSGGNVTMAGAMSVPRIELSNGGLGGTNALTVTETLNWSGGVHSGAGTTYIPAGATLSLNTTTKYLDGRTINNDGTITWMGADIIYVQNGAVINNRSLFDAQNNSSFYWNGGAASTFNNTGTFRKSAGAGTTYFSSNVIFNNSGTVNTQVGTLSVQGGGSSSGLWNTPAGAAVAFPASTYTLTAGTSITGAGAFRATGATVTVAAGVSAQKFELVNGTLNGAGTLTVTNSLDWSGGVMTGSGSTNIPSGATLSINTATKYLDTRTLNNAGTTTWMDASVMYLQNGATINNSGLFNFQGDTGLYWNGGAVATFNNTGTLRKSAGTGITVLSNNVVLNNPGSVEVQAGTLSVQGGGSSNSSFTVASGTVLLFTGTSYTLNAGANITGAGLARLNGTLVITGGVSAQNFELLGGTLTGAGTFTAMNSLNWLGGVMSGSGSTNIPAGATLSLAGTTKYLDVRTLNNAGTANWSAADVYLTNSSIISNTGLFDAQASLGLYWNGGGLTTFNNAGTFRKSGGMSGSTVLGSNVLFNNNGTASVQVGTLVVQGGGSAAGGFSLSSGALLNFVSTNYTLGGGADITGAGIARLSGGSLTAAAGVSAQNFELTNGTLTGAGIFTVTDTFLWSGGVMSGTGVTVLGAASTSSFNGGTRYIDARTLTNLGTITWTAGELYMQNGGTFNNNAQGLPGPSQRQLHLFQWRHGLYFQQLRHLHQVGWHFRQLRNDRLQQLRHVECGYRYGNPVRGVLQLRLQHPHGRHVCDYRHAALHRRQRDHKRRYARAGRPRVSIAGPVCIERPRQFRHKQPEWQLHHQERAQPLHLRLLEQRGQCHDWSEQRLEPDRRLHAERGHYAAEQQHAVHHRRGRHRWRYAHGYGKRGGQPHQRRAGGPRYVARHPGHHRRLHSERERRARH